MESDESVTTSSTESIIGRDPDRRTLGHDDQADRLPPPTGKAPQLVTWVAAVLSTVAVGMDVISRAAEEGDVRDWAQWLMIAAIAVAIVALVAGMGGTAQLARHVAPLVGAVILFGVAVWMRDHYADDAVGTPIRAIIAGGVGVLLLLARNVMTGAVRTSSDEAVPAT